MITSDVLWKVYSKNVNVQHRTSNIALPIRLGPCFAEALRFDRPVKSRYVSADHEMNQISLEIMEEE